MEIANSTVLVTGANRGIGRALVEEALGKAPNGSTPVPGNPWHTQIGASRP